MQRRTASNIGAFLLADQPRCRPMKCYELESRPPVNRLVAGSNPARGAKSHFWSDCAVHRVLFALGWRWFLPTDQTVGAILAERPVCLAVSTSTYSCAIVNPCAAAYSLRSFNCAGIEKPSFSCSF